MEESHHKTAVLLGTTGLVGSYCLTYLLQDKNYKTVITLNRKNLLIKNDKLINHKIDFDNLSDYSDVIKGDDFFYCLGSTIKKAGSKEYFRKVDLDYTIEIAKLAFKNGAKQFLIVTAIDANPNSKLFYNRIKGEIEREITKIKFNTICIFRPSVILGDRNELRIKEKIAKPLFKLFSFVFVGKYKRYMAIKAETIALAMVKTADKNLTGINIFETDAINDIAI